MKTKTKVKMTPRTKLLRAYFYECIGFQNDGWRKLQELHFGVCWLCCYSLRNSSLVCWIDFTDNKLFVSVNGALVKVDDYEPMRKSRLGGSVLP